MNTENKMEELEKSIHGMIDAAFRLRMGVECKKETNSSNRCYVNSYAPDEHDFCANAQSPKLCDCSCEMPDDASCKEMKIRDLQERVDRLLEMNSNLRMENDILHDKICRIADIAK